MAIFRNFFGVFSWFFTLLLKTLIFDAIGMGFGRVLGGAGEGFGRVWEPLGRCWELPGLLFAVFRMSERSQDCCMLFFVFFWIFYIFGVVVALSDASAASVARPQGCCLLFFVIFCFSQLFLIVL